MSCGHVVFGKQDSAAIDLSVIVAGKNTIGFVIKGESRHDYSGYSVSSAGDVNGDGLDDLIIGANSANPSGKIKAGKSYVVFGKQGTDPIELSAIVAGTGGFVINGESAKDYSGYSVSSAGDVHGDGSSAVMLLALITMSSLPTPALNTSIPPLPKKDNTSVIELSAIAAGTGGFVIKGESANDYSGYSVSSAGDVNGDGLDDLIVGAYGANPNGKSHAGKSYVIFGKTDTDAIYLSKLGDESKYTIDYLGDKNANTLTGTTKNEIFVAGAGNDTLIGNGGMDVFNAGVGNDNKATNTRDNV
jgi:Ca2+-binding RTX toxin-like protein